MRVNISGRGVIPGLNVIAPVRNVELGENAIKRLINFHQFQVYDAATGRFINKHNVDEFFKPVKKVQPVKKVEPPKPTATPPVVEEKKVEEPTPIAEEEVKPMITFLNTTEKEVEEVAEETVQEEVVEKEEYVTPEIYVTPEHVDVEETSEEEENKSEDKPKYYGKKKRNRR